MKKLLVTIIILISIFTLSISVFAKNGDVIGHIYSTDIRAYVNGVEVESYNIGGRTAIVLEDVLGKSQYVYDDSTRSLKFFSLSPDYLNENKSQGNAVSGKLIGNIYETDIKTSIYGVVVPAYNIGGKTAVVIEEIGYDGAFSTIGGKYIWNAKERTISLEFLYKTPKAHSSDRNLILTPSDNFQEMSATFEKALHCGNYQEQIKLPEGNTVNERVMPIKSDGVIIGYYFHRPPNDSFAYYYPKKVKAAEEANTVVPHKTREEIISHFVNNHSVGGPRERFDTDNYSFVYISVAGTSWTAYNLLQIFDDGTYIDYAEKIQTLNRSPQNLVIDKENEKVTFKYVDRYTSEWFTYYEIDLKTRKITAFDALETDIGVGRSAGQPPMADQSESKSGQYEYILTSGEETKTVNGFFAREYYYADMLPLAETFDFLKIKYSFVNGVLTIDTRNARPFEYKQTEKTVDVLKDSPIKYLDVKKVLLNGEETKITYSYISGHFDNTNEGRADAMPYVCQGKVYINSSFISWLYK